LRVCKEWISKKHLLAILLQLLVSTMSASVKQLLALMNQKLYP
jgi:hypothetical protein